MRKTPVDQNRILALVVAAHPGSISASALQAQLGNVARQPVLLNIARLVQRKFAERVNRKTWQNQSEPLYAVTDAGLAFFRSGKLIKPGSRGPHTGVRKPIANTFRERVWKALRIRKKATTADLVEMAREPHDGEAAYANAHLYLKALCRAGVAAELPTRQKGYAPTSNGFIRFALLRDLGPLAPIASKRHLINLNAQTDADKFLPYGEKQ